jgi:perosamine synthetase
LKTTRVKQVKEPVLGSLLGPEEIAAVLRVVSEGQALSRGPEIDKFEEAFAKHLGVKYCVALSSCTAALRLAFQSLNLGKKDHVIVPVNAFWNAVAYLIEKNVQISYVDVNRYSLTIDVSMLKSLVKKNTKAILSYTHGGNPNNMRDLREFCNNHELILIEDSAHGNGSEWENQSIAHWADIACYSFSTLKNMTTLGEGGLIATNSQVIADRIKLLRSCYPIGSYVEAKRGKIDATLEKFLKPGDFFRNDWKSLESVGSKFVMTTPQAAVGLVQLGKLKEMNSKRQKIAENYNANLANITDVKLWEVSSNAKHSWHLFQFFLTGNLINHRMEIIHELRENYNIEIVNRFWPLSKNALFVMKKVKGKSGVYEDLVNHQIMALPISPVLSEDEIDYVITSTINVIKSKR